MKAETRTSGHQYGFHFTVLSLLVISPKMLISLSAFFPINFSLKQILQMSTTPSSSRFRPSFNNQHKNTFPKRYHYVNTKLEVRKIPRELNNITKLNEHFSKFGTIVNIQVRCTICCFATSKPAKRLQLSLSKGSF